MRAVLEPMIQQRFLAKLLAREQAENELSAAPAPRDAHCCLICTEPTNRFAFGACNHAQLCIDCVIKKRALFKDFACVMCKAENPSMVVVNMPPEERPFQSYSVDGMNMVQNTGCFFENRRDALSVRQKLSFRCPICVKKGHTELFSKKNLRAHVESMHNLTLCGVCLDHRKVFCHEQRLYTKKQLQDHFRRGDVARDGHAPLPAHPTCKFCSRRKFFNREALDQHERDAHFLCTVCPRKNLFPNYERLNDHFNKQHFMCDHPSCLEQRFIVFKTKLELQSHKVTVHNDKSARRITLNPAPIGSYRGRNVFNETASEAYDGPMPSTGSSGTTAMAAPPQVDVRSQDKAVKRRLQEALGGDQISLRKFREESHKYRRGLISAAEYVSFAQA